MRTAQTENPGRGPLRLVALVGYGTVSEVLPLIAMARACPSTAPLRVKFTTGGPKPWLMKPPPATVNVAGALARSMGFGVMPVTHGGVQGLESETVSVMLPMST